MPYTTFIKRSLLLLSGVLFAPVVFSQFEGRQPDSVYKISKVKSMRFRYADWGLQNNKLTIFDKNGKPLTETMFDKSGEKKWLQTLFQYDSSGKLVKTLYCSYMNHDKKTFQDKPDSVLDSSRINILSYQYDKLGKLIKMQGTIGPDKTPSEISFYYDPLITVWKFHKLKDSLVTTHITVYETPYVMRSIYSSYDSCVATKNTWAENYQNEFDGSGKLIKRITTLPTIPDNPSSYKETFYEYNEKGLLIKTYWRRVGFPEIYGVRLYDYEYWDDCEAGSLVSK